MFFLTELFYFMMSLQISSFEIILKVIKKKKKFPTFSCKKITTYCSLCFCKMLIIGNINCVDHLPL